MTAKQRAVTWVGGAVAGIACMVVGVLLVRAGLEDADRWASIIGMIVAVIGFPLSVYSIVLARRALVSNAPPVGVQVIAGGSRSIAAQNLTGSASTGNGPAAVPPAATANPSPDPGHSPDHEPTAAAADSPAQVPVRIEASGDRAIAAQNISGAVSTGDNSPITP
jgi:hypothetical protein